MLTAKDAAQIAGERNVDLGCILGLIKESAEEGEWFLTLEQDELDDEKANALRSLGYTIEWNRLYFNTPLVGVEILLDGRRNSDS